MKYLNCIPLGIFFLILLPSLSYSQQFDYIKLSCQYFGKEERNVILRKSLDEGFGKIETFNLKSNGIDYTDTLVKKTLMKSFKVEKEVLTLLNSINLNEILKDVIRDNNFVYYSDGGCLLEIGSSNFLFHYSPEFIYSKKEFKESPERKIIGILKKNSRTCFFKRNWNW